MAKLQGAYVKKRQRPGVTIACFRRSKTLFKQSEISFRRTVDPKETDVYLVFEFVSHTGFEYYVATNGKNHYLLSKPSMKSDDSSDFIAMDRIRIRAEESSEIKEALDR